MIGFSVQQDESGRWRIYKDRAPLDPHVEGPGELIAFCAKLSALGNLPALRDFGIAERTLINNELCPIARARNNWLEIDRRGRWLVAVGMQRGSEPFGLAVASGDSLVAPLAAILHEHYVACCPPPPSPLRPEERKAVARREAAMALAVAIMRGDGVVSPSDLIRANIFIRSLEELLST